MGAVKEDDQGKIWELLYGRIKQLLRRFGVENYLGKADYLVVDDNHGFPRHTIEIHKLQMLRPDIIRSLQSLLRELPSWEIVVLVDIPGKEKIWPAMGVTIRAAEIVDGLQRQYLPKEFRTVEFEGSRPGTGCD